MSINVKGVLNEAQGTGFGKIRRGLPTLLCPGASHTLSHMPMGNLVRLSPLTRKALLSLILHIEVSYDFPWKKGSWSIKCQKLQL